MQWLGKVFQNTSKPNERCGIRNPINFKCEQLRFQDRFYENMTLILISIETVRDVLFDNNNIAMKDILTNSLALLFQ